ncbi:MAG: hypothetical protein KIT31_40205, partial [Deltaproteobacteria bacterium]|nr:hypothetical protein [Deltaproteobacteria bacterium]
MLVRAGYLDAVGVHGMLPLSRGAPDDLELLPGPVATLVSTFARHGAVVREALEAALGDAELCAALLRLGVVLDRGGRLSTGDLVALPLDGRIAFVPSPHASPDAYVGPDLRQLFQRMAPTPGDALVLGGGVGLYALRAAVTARRVVTVESDPVAAGCAELNFAMNAVEARVESRTGAVFDVGVERFDRVVADLPQSPVPLHGTSVYEGLDGPEVARRVLALLPDLLADGGIAQLSCAWHGTPDGPDFGLDLGGFAVEHGLRIAVTAP